MGTTLHGIIECFCEQTSWSLAHWEDCATVEFNKDYALQHALSAALHDADERRNWLLPEYMRRGAAAFEDSTSAEQVRKADIAHDGGWATAPELCVIAEKMREVEDEKPSCTLVATIAFMRAMETTFPKVRLLYYHL